MLHPVATSPSMVRRDVAVVTANAPRMSCRTLLIPDPLTCPRSAQLLRRPSSDTPVQVHVPRSAATHRFARTSDARCEHRAALSASPSSRLRRFPRWRRGTGCRLRIAGPTTPRGATHARHEIYTSSGDHIWSTLYEAGLLAAQAEQCLVDADGRILATGNSYQDWLKPALFAYSADGELLWLQSAMGAQGFWVRGLTVDGAGDVVIATTLFASHDFGFGWLDADPTDAFIAAYATSGAPRWVTRLGGDEGDGATALTTTSFGVVTAGYQGHVSELDHGHSTTIAEQAFAVLLDAEGGKRWAWLHQTAGLSEAVALLPSALPGVWVAGQESLSRTTNAFLARVDAEGAERALLSAPSITHVVGLHRKDATTVLLVGDDRTGGTYPGETVAQAIRLIAIDEDG
jgi:hypothetical protein